MEHAGLPATCTASLYLDPNSDMSKIGYIEDPGILLLLGAS